jgi:hypothetical protein
MFVDEHPLTLNLDIDRVRCLLGGWRDRFGEAGALVRPIALAMATIHLRAGYDVVMPQFLARVSEIERFAAVARDSAATFIELAVMDTRECAIERFYNRGTDADSTWHAEVKELVERSGGRNSLAQMYDELSAALAQRPHTRVFVSQAGSTRETYAELCQALLEPQT